MKTRVFAQYSMYKISVERNGLDLLLLSDGPRGTEYSTICNCYEAMVAFCLISKLKNVLTT